MSVKSFFSYK